ncbi:MAG: hypothetical protein H0W50_09610 [Parachlamydiaceae bacterium]|nr:hypothetical protein [Parachlamydiaceae bacterium]
MALEEEKNNLKAAFIAAENDFDLKETMNDWGALDGEKGDWDAENISKRYTEERSNFGFLALRKP